MIERPWTRAHHGLFCQARQYAATAQTTTLIARNAQHDREQPCLDVLAVLQVANASQYDQVDFLKRVVDQGRRHAQAAQVAEDKVEVLTVERMKAPLLVCCEREARGAVDEVSRARCSGTRGVRARAWSM